MNSRSPYEIWLSKARDDLEWTEANIREQIYYGACFTAQQAAEKALKAYLLSKGKKIRKIHDLGALLEECRQIDAEFDELQEAAATLTDYYIEVRYPDISGFMDYTEKQAEEAIKFSKQIVEFVEERIK